MTSEHPHRIVVVGGGYAGAIAAIRAAGRARGRAQVTLVDPDGVLVQRLRLHQVAAGQQVAQVPLGKLTGRRVTHVRGWATAIDTRANELHVRTSEGATTLGFDSVIVTTGSTIDLAGAPASAHSLAETAAALRLRDALDGAGAATVVGGGMTGIEAATELAEAHPRLAVRMIVSGGLGDWLAPRARDYLARTVADLGIEVVEDTGVGPDDELDGVVVWCGGFVARPLARDAGLAVDERGRVLVDGTLRSLSHPRILAAGDAAAAPRLANGAAVRMTCQAGMPMAAHAADTVVAALRGNEATGFDFGYIHQPISLGRRRGLIQWVDRADVPKASALTGRRAALYKNVVCGAAITSLKLERRLPGATRWPRAGAPRRQPAPVPSGGGVS